MREAVRIRERPPRLAREGLEQQLLRRGRVVPEEREPCVLGAQDHTTWRDYGGASDSAQYSALKQITPKNVNQLEVAWTYPTADGRKYFFNPLTDDGIARAAELAAKPAKPMDNTDFNLLWRKRVVREFVAYALRELRGDDMREQRWKISRST